MTARQIDAFLKRVSGGKSPLIGQGKTFVQAGRRYGVSPALLVAIAGAESSFGVHARNNNAFGWGPHIPFGSWAEGINAVAKGLRTGYLNEGRKSVAQIGAKWAPIGAGNDPTNLNSNWVKNVNSYLKQLGGGPISTGPASAGSGGGPAAQATLVSPAGPDTGSSAMNAIAAITAGEKYDPLAQAAELASSFGAPEISGPALPDDTPAGQARGSANIRAGGGWGGSRSVAAGAYAIARRFGAPITSEKRSTKLTASGGVSDHWEGSKGSWAADIAATGKTGDRIAKAIARRYGISWSPGSWASKTIKVGNRTYRLQLGWRVEGHYDHVHFGVKLV